MLLHLNTARFLCSVVAALARLVRALRKASIMASACCCSPSPVAVLTAPAMAAVSPIGLIASTPLPKRKKTLAHAHAHQHVAAIPESNNLLVVAAPPPPVVVLPPALPAVVVEQQQQPHQSIAKTTTKAALAARRRPTSLVIPVVDDAGEVAASWAAAAAAAPAKEADVVEVEGDGFWLASRAGPRHAMEDAYAVVTDQNHADSQLAFYGVFDGHGGRTAVDFVSERLSKNVVSAVLAAAGTESTTHGEASSHDGVSAAIRAAYLATDSELLTQHQDARGGACATTAVVINGDLYVAHLGDCRAVLSRDGGAATALTADHTCAMDEERERIERQGGYVSRSGSGVWRVQGSLAVSRAFGDGALKQWGVVAEPAVTRVPLVAGCEFLVIASDGLWDKVSNQEAVDVVVSRSRGTACCRELVDMARRRGSRDDVTVMVVDLQRFVR